MPAVRSHDACPGIGIGIARAAGLGLGLLADAVVADPARGHPVAGVGRLATRAEALVYRPTKARGFLHLSLSTLPLTVGAAAVQSRLQGRLSRAVFMAALTWAAVGSQSLQREARQLSERLAAGDLAGARARMPNLVGRDPALLDATGMARAAIESVAENTADAAVGALFWGAVAGPTGVVAYRIVNTLDAMVGHHSERYERFGFAAARLDDGAGLVPARLTAALTVLLARRVKGQPQQAWKIWRRDAAAHPSPNAGPCEAAFAGALGIRLGGPTSYAYGTQERPWHGDGRDPDSADVLRAAELSRDVTIAAGAVCILLALLVSR